MTETVAATPPPPAIDSRPPYRRDIQHLRALAVTVVVVYHLWPQALPGGFIGVDVFFVISGFLITQHLVRELSTTGTIRLRRFWSRRIRRLLPAAALVIVVSLAASVMLLPPQELVGAASQSIGSALWVQNWVLAVQSVDYLAAGNAPTPFQHYWSLSIEEQFYALWPLLLLGAASISRGPRVIIAMLLVVGVTSFSLSLILTATDPALAYFATPVRAWEFVVGAAVALAMGHRSPRDSRWQSVAGWLGVIAIVVGCLVIDRSTPFPGVAALLPVVGAALTLASPPRATRHVPSLISRGSERLGDLSYSVYLWHWPLIVLIGSSGQQSSIARGSVILGASVALAWATERWIERPIRFGAGFQKRYSAVAIAVVCALAVCIPATAIIAVSTARAEEARAEAVAATGCLGADAAEGALDDRCAPFREDESLYPPLDARLADTAGQYECYIAAGNPLTDCGYGSTDASVRIAIVGDSHAASWIPAILPTVEAEGWRLDVFSGRRCQLIRDPECAAGDAILTAVTNGGYDIVLASAWRQSQPPVDEIESFWQTLTARGVAVAAITDVPLFAEETEACVVESTTPRDVELCTTPRDTALQPAADNYTIAARQLGLPVVDLTERLCDDATCPAVIGRVMVYRDSPYSHLTATFSRTLATSMGEALRALVESSQ